MWTKGDRGRASRALDAADGHPIRPGHGHPRAAGILLSTTSGRPALRATHGRSYGRDLSLRSDRPSPRDPQGRADPVLPRPDPGKIKRDHGPIGATDGLRRPRRELRRARGCSSTPGAEPITPGSEDPSSTYGHPSSTSLDPSSRSRSDASPPRPRRTIGRCFACRWQHKPSRRSLERLGPRPGFLRGTCGAWCPEWAR